MRQCQYLPRFNEQRRHLREVIELPQNLDDTGPHGLAHLRRDVGGLAHSECSDLGTDCSCVFRVVPEEIVAAAAASGGEVLEEDQAELGMGIGQVIPDVGGDEERRALPEEGPEGVRAQRQELRDGLGDTRDGFDDCLHGHAIVFLLQTRKQMKHPPRVSSLRLGGGPRTRRRARGGAGGRRGGRERGGRPVVARGPVHKDEREGLAGAHLGETGDKLPEQQRCMPQMLVLRHRLTFRDGRQQPCPSTGQRCPGLGVEHGEGGDAQRHRRVERLDIAELVAQVVEDLLAQQLLQRFCAPSSGTAAERLVGHSRALRRHAGRPRRHWHWSGGGGGVVRGGGGSEASGCAWRWWRDVSAVSGYKEEWGYEAPLGHGSCRHLGNCRTRSPSGPRGFCSATTARSARPYDRDH
mmetsp:Transcript_127417/g.407778  ORF Transcript_127417/g.407778 Transcript_127417/m.407778 type:complete len:409 (+) Transcript_127417:1028-2254(+)